MITTINSNKRESLYNKDFLRSGNNTFKYDNPLSSYDLLIENNCNNKLVNKLTAISLSVALPELNVAALSVVAGVAIVLKALNNKDNADRKKSILNDVGWLGSGLAAKTFLTDGLLGISKSNKILGFFVSLLTFAIGSELIFPLLKRLIGNQKEVNKSNSVTIEKNKIDIKNPMPIIMDKYNVARIILPDSLIERLVSYFTEAGWYRQVNS